MVYDPSTIGLLKRAGFEARQLRHLFVGPGHLLLALAREPGEVDELFTAFGIEYHAVQESMIRLVGKGPDAGPPGHLRIGPRLRRVLERAGTEAVENEVDEVNPSHVLLAIIREGRNVALTMLREVGADIPICEGK